jgi:heat shock protein HslJ
MIRIPFVLLAVVLMISATLGLAACRTSISLLEDRAWYLMSYGSPGALKPIIENTQITATFNSGSGEVNGSAGCNNYFAEYSINEDTLSIIGMAATEMACLSPEGVMEQEQEFLALLASAQSFQASNSILTIFCADGQQLYFRCPT